MVSRPLRNINHRFPGSQPQPPEFLSRRSQGTQQLLASSARSWLSVAGSVLGICLVALIKPREGNWGNSTSYYLNLNAGSYGWDEFSITCIWMYLAFIAQIHRYETFPDHKQNKTDWIWGKLHSSGRNFLHKLHRHWTTSFTTSSRLGALGDWDLGGSPRLSNQDLKSSKSCLVSASSSS